MDPRFLNLGISRDEWSASSPGRFTAGERAPGTHWIGGQPQNRSEQRGEKKNLARNGTRTPTPLLSSP
jgi:hypothetical protein